LINKQKAIDEPTWVEFKNLLNQVDFWNLQTSERIHKRLVILDDGSQAEEIRMSFDGAQWLLEGKIAPQYHVVVRWSPKKESKFFQCCDFLIKLTDLEISDQEKY